MEKSDLALAFVLFHNILEPKLHLTPRITQYHLLGEIIVSLVLVHFYKSRGKCRIRITTLLRKALMWIHYNKYASYEVAVLYLGLFTKVCALLLKV